MRWRLLALTLVLALVSLALIGFVVPREDTPDDPDAVVVLGGGTPARAALGIEVAERHDAELVLSSTAAIFGERLGRRCGEDAVCYEPDPSNTSGEAATTARMLEEHGWDHVTVVTSWFHISRARMLLHQCLAPGTVSVVGTETTGTWPWQAYVIAREALAVVVDATIRRAC